MLRRGPDASSHLNRRGRRLAVTQLSLATALTIIAVLLLRSHQVVANVSSGYAENVVIKVELGWEHGAPARLHPSEQPLRELGERSVQSGLTLAFSIRGAYEGPASSLTTPSTRSDDTTQTTGGRALGIFRKNSTRSASLGLWPYPSIWVVDTNYFRVAGMRVATGRTFGAEPTNGIPVAIVTQKLANVLFPGQNAVGQEFQLGVGGRVFEIVGVTANIVEVRTGDRGLTANPLPDVFLPRSQNISSSSELYLRTSGHQPSVLPGIRNLLRDVEPSASFVTLSYLSDYLQLWRRGMVLIDVVITVIASLTLGLAALGLFAVLMQMSASRTREFGIRAALGAEPRDIVLLTLRRAGSIIAWGTIGGLLITAPLALLATRLIWGISPWSPGIYAVSLIGLGGVAALASVIPAVSSAQVNPSDIIRDP